MITRRLAVAYGEEASFGIATEGDRTVATFVLPLAKEAAEDPAL